MGKSSLWILQNSRGQWGIEGIIKWPPFESFKGIVCRLSFVACPSMSSTDGVPWNNRTCKIHHLSTRTQHISYSSPLTKNYLPLLDRQHLLLPSNTHPPTMERRATSTWQGTRIWNYTIGLSSTSSNVFQCTVIHTLRHHSCQVSVHAFPCMRLPLRTITFFLQAF